ncbi:ABC transporter permease [Paenibacillus sp. CGMCC 1.16610]|uniref:FtsX-like permease family protein n=1 Tax=Paenibacillus anseongense TaxID=2682845 RepID=A0ABW9UAD8_9BACL|nr:MULTISPECIES: ABC transporter permease [Paenibacillus]MBA2937168.1 ABC transporter permease [Paenibacillus sp. CGMCC 1.16610]MVQ36230.1 FtsX-like permease family protein [Paenibacillus anseongense]
MNFRQFAIHNVVRNKKIYMAHFLSSAFSVMIFFIFALLMFHPDLEGGLVSSSGTISELSSYGILVSEIIIFVFSFFFLLYSVSAFLKVRKKEFGILILLGMSKRQLNRMLFIENAWIGLVALIFGIGAGLIFSKLVLLASAQLLVIENGLRFYVPLKAVLMTIAAFGILFLVIASLTSVMAGRLRVSELIVSDEKPKPEPAASIGLAILGCFLLIAGYGIVLDFAINSHFSFKQLFLGVVLTIAGTYLLFTQTSVYVLRMLRGRKLFFRKTNMLTLSELIYRMRDNAATFFIVSVVSAMAFTGIGTTLSLGDPGLASMVNPYAFSYTPSAHNEEATRQKLELIGDSLKESEIAYKVHPLTAISTDTGYVIAALSEYNQLAEDLGYPAETLGGDEQMFVTPSYVWQKENYTKSGAPTGELELTIGDRTVTPHIVKYVPHLVLAEIGYAGTLVVTDNLYNDLLKGVSDESPPFTRYQYTVQDWQKTLHLSKQLVDTINNDNERDDYLRSLALEWVATKQKNGMLLIVSGLVGIVFFTFAAGTIYFRLYADMDRDEKQYGMIAKIGLSGKELSKIISSQLLLMFFVPLIVALVHSTVAFVALQRLVEFSITGYSLAIFASFAAIQLVYFLVARWRTIEHLRRKLAEPTMSN